MKSGTSVIWENNKQLTSVDETEVLTLSHIEENLTAENKLNQKKIDVILNCRTIHWLWSKCADKFLLAKIILFAAWNMHFQAKC